MNRLITLAILCAGVAFGQTAAAIANLAWTTNLVNANSSTGAATCDFNLGYMCVINDNGYAGTYITLSVANIPPAYTDVKIVFLGAHLHFINWPSGIMWCPQGDTEVGCPSTWTVVVSPNAGGGAPAKAIGSGTWTSDGTYLHARGDTGNLPFMWTAHLQAQNISMENLGSANPNQPVSYPYGGIMLATNTACYSLANPALCGNATSGIVTIAAAATSTVINMNAQLGTATDYLLFVTQDWSARTNQKLSLSATAVATTTGTASSGSTALTVASGTGIVIGQYVVGSGITTGTTIASGSGTTWVLSANTTAPLSSTTLNFFSPVVCNTTSAPAGISGAPNNGQPTIATAVAPTTNPACYDFWVIGNP